MNGRESLRRYAYLSIAAALVTIGLKSGAYFLTGSVGLLSDALESLVNLAAAIVALAALVVASRPPDDSHEFGHDKIEYFSAGIEGTLILVAAGSIVVTSLERLFRPQPLEQLGLGIAISIIASGVNLGVALTLMRVGKQRDSITLQADARHLMTDVWTSVGVLAGVGLVALTGIERLDPIVALIVAANIVRIGIVLVRGSFDGLMDTSVSVEDRESIDRVLRVFQGQGIQFHALRTRQAAARRFMTVHVLVPPQWTIKKGHDVVEQIEHAIRAAVPNAHVLTHLEPLGDPAAQEDVTLDRSS
ncbi:MAG: cation transporter [Chloroflexi bacterium]|nr:cation transporter [Chloroflexota bacterium]